MNEMIVPPSSAVHQKIQNNRKWNPFFKVGIITSPDSYCTVGLPFHGVLFF
jgi:hypothetical protein